MDKQNIESTAETIVKLCRQCRHFEAGNLILGLHPDDARKVIARISRWGYTHISRPLEVVLSHGFE